MKRVLICGAYGQVGQELFIALSKKYGPDNIICTDMRIPPKSLGVKHHLILDVQNR